MSWLKIETRRDRAEAARGARWTYALLDARQREIADEVRGGQPGRVLLSEVAPVLTVGRRTPESDLLVSSTQLGERGIELYRVDRGGFATYHGPGQWVLFVVESLEALTGDRRGVRRAVEGLLEHVRACAEHFGVRAEIRSGCELGVWTPRGKLAALGIQVDRGVLQHGVALNVLRTPESFYGLKPCGLDAPVAYLAEELGRLEAPSGVGVSTGDDEFFEKIGLRLAQIKPRPFY